MNHGLLIRGVPAIDSDNLIPKWHPKLAVRGLFIQGWPYSVWLQWKTYYFNFKQSVDMIGHVTSPEIVGDDRLESADFVRQSEAT